MISVLGEAFVDFCSWEVFVNFGCWRGGGKSLVSREPVSQQTDLCHGFIVFFTKIRYTNHNNAGCRQQKVEGISNNVQLE